MKAKLLSQYTINTVVKTLFLKPEQSVLFYIIVILAYLVVAFNSSGYYHWDEHYQIIEFANYKLGNSSPEHLAWEYKATIRPSLQPGICFVIFKLFKIAGITAPFFLALVLRLFTGILAIVAIRIFVRHVKPLISAPLHPFFVFLSYFLWFLPFINIRFAAESWSGLLFLLVAGMVQSGYYRKTLFALLLIAALMGLSILFKYQSALLGLGLFSWMLFIDKPGIRKIAIMITSVFVVLAFGFLLDKWMYGRFTFTLYNYFYVNLIDGVASNYGTAPWYEIIFYILINPGPIGLIILIALGYVIIYKPKNPIVWSVIPYIVIHSLIPHKELRFLFPLVNLVPFILVYGYQQYTEFSQPIWHRLSGILFFILILSNMTGLIMISLKGAGTAKIAITEYIGRNYNKQRVNLIYTNGGNPYQEWESPRNTFYLHKNMTFSPAETIWKKDFTDQLKKGYLNLLVIPAADMTGPETYRYLEELKFRKVYQNIPWLLQQMNKWYKKEDNNEVMTLFEYQLAM